MANEFANGLIIPAEKRLRPEGFYGLFALFDFPAGTVLRKIRPLDMHKEPTRFSVQIGPNAHLRNEDLQWIMYTNHKCDANVRFVFPQPSGLDSPQHDPLTWVPEEVHMVAAKDIARDEEITFNYLTTEYSMNEHFECACQSAHCFGRIGGFKMLPLKDKLSLRPRISPYLEAMLEKELSTIENVGALQIKRSTEDN